MKDSGAQGVQVSHVPFQLMLSIDGIRIGQIIIIIIADTVIHTVEVDNY